MAPVSDVVDVLPKVKALALADRAMFDRGMRAFVSTVQAYAKHECSLIFRVKGEKKSPSVCTDAQV
jgi:ATP-dependent RNA helicase DDX55/SPB4